MPPICPRPITLATVLTLALTHTTSAGVESVAPSQPVFVPPFAADLGNPELADPVSATDETGEAGEADETEIAAAAAATRGFEAALVLCSSLPQAEYQVDCLSDQLEQFAQALPETPEFSEARSIVRDTAQKLNRVARDNASRVKRPARLRQATGPTPQRSARAVVPVATERVSEAAGLATEILREAETQLLRASERSERRKVAYTDIATAVGSSSLILLRAQ